MVTITPATKNVYAVDDLSIICNLFDIPGQINGVVWTFPTTITDSYTLIDGTFDAATKSQVSSLTVYSDTLIELRRSAASHTFTCKIVVGSHGNTTVEAIQTVTIFHPGRNKFLNESFKTCSSPTH